MAKTKLLFTCFAAVLFRSSPVLQATEDGTLVGIKDGWNGLLPNQEAPLPEFARSRKSTGVCLHDIRDERLLEKAQEAGFSFVRTDLFWEAVQHGDRFDFGKFSDLLRRLEAHQMGALFILGYKHQEFSPAAPTTQNEIEAFSRYVNRAIEQFRASDVKFELWNEPNTREGWLQSPNAKGYSELATQILKGVEQTHGEIKISSGGLSTIDQGYLTQLGKAMDLNRFDAISVHPYRQSDPESVLADYASLRAHLRDAGITRPELWDSEWGYPSFGYQFVSRWGDGRSQNARNAQAIYVVRRLLADWITGVDLTALYELRDDTANGQSRESNFGLLNSDDTPKPAFIAVKELMQRTRRVTDAKIWISKDKQIFILSFKSPGTISFVAWSRSASFSLSVPAPGKNRYLYTGDVFGTEITKENAQEAQILKVSADGGPVYVTYSDAPH
ncbi:hypothetical protein [Paraburkholderia sp. GAS348]|uniref:hypothetical protein n=1 Tax=Paraburkholderia sp. GAS348 TaxID=3035132 RepID=UPI003D1D570C